MFSLNLGNSQEEDKESEKIKEKGKTRKQKIFPSLPGLFLQLYALS